MPTKCIYEGCIKYPVYNYDGQSKAIYCNQHKLDNMVDVKHTKCHHVNCIKRPVYNYNGQPKGLC